MASPYSSRSSSYDWQTLRGFVTKAREYCNWKRLDGPLRIDVEFQELRVSLSNLLRSYSIYMAFLRHPGALTPSQVVKARAESATRSSGDLVGLANWNRLIEPINRVYGDSDGFAAALIAYFSRNPSELPIFGEVTFPSIFGYFLVPDILDTAVDVMLSILSSSDPMIAVPLVVAFFEIPPRFLDTLVSLFADSLQSTTELQTPILCYQLFIPALRLAVGVLTGRHRALIRAAVAASSALFWQIFITGLLIPNLELFFPNGPIVIALKYAVTRRESLPALLVEHAFRDSPTDYTDEHELLGWGKELSVTDLRTILSPCELVLCMKVLSVPVHALPAACDPWVAGAARFYPRVPPRVQESLNIVPFGPRAKFGRDNEEFASLYNKLVNAADKYGTTVLEILEAPSPVAEIRLAQESVTLRSEKFRDYCFTQMTNEAYDQMVGFDRRLTALQAAKSFGGAETTSRTIIQELLVVMALKFDFSEPEFALRRKVNAIRPKGRTFTNWIVEKLAVPGMSRAEGPESIAWFLARFRHSLKLALGERLVQIAKLVEMVRSHGDSADGLLWMILQRLETSAFYIVFTTWVCNRALFSGTDPLARLIDDSFQFVHTVVERYAFADQPESLQTFRQYVATGGKSGQ